MVQGDHGFGNAVLAEPRLIGRDEPRQQIRRERFDIGVVGESSQRFQVAAVAA
jgi:hypothetical protein